MTRPMTMKDGRPIKPAAVPRSRFANFTPSIMDSKESIDVTEKVQSGHDVVTVDEGARRMERRLRAKIDFFVVPTVTLLYLMWYVIHLATFTVTFH
jgi:hypothetical protein